MLGFTQAKSFTPIIFGEQAGCWMSGQTYSFFENDDKSGRAIIVEIGAISNGADVPPPFLIAALVFCGSVLFLGLQGALVLALAVTALVAWLFPRVHAEYITAVFIHDIGLTQYRDTLSRWKIDVMFLKAMRVERWPMGESVKAVPRHAWRMIRPYIIFTGVVLWGLLKERSNYFKPKGT